MKTSALPDHSPLRRLVIIPAFNERQSVAKLVRRLQRSLPGYDVLVIDDGSTDDTLRQIPADVAVVSLPFNLGIGGAMQTGYRYAALHGYDVAVQVDGDGQHRPGEVWRLVEHLIATKSDLVVGSRFLGDGRYKQSLTRMIGIHILDAMIRGLSGLQITDCTSGFRVANRRVIRAFAHWYPDDYPEPEVILLLHRSGYRIEEVGVKMRQRRAGMTSIPLTRGLFYVAKVAVALLLDMARNPWPTGKVAEPITPMIRTTILLMFGGTLLLLAVRRLRQFRLKERYSLLFFVLGLPFLFLAVWPEAIGYLAGFTKISYSTVMLFSISAFLILINFELLSIVSVQDRKITTLAQMVGMLMEQQKLVDRAHHGINPKDEPGVPQSEEMDG